MNSKNYQIRKLERLRNKSKIFEDRAKELNDRQIEGEIWFQNELIRAGYKEISNKESSNSMISKKYKYIKNLPIKYYIFDFAIPSKNILIEVDGESHTIYNQHLRDRRKDLFAEKNGYILIRLQEFNSKQLEKAMNSISKAENIKSNYKFKIKDEKPKSKKVFVDNRLYHYKSDIRIGTTVSGDEISRLKNHTIPAENRECPF